MIAVIGLMKLFLFYFYNNFLLTQEVLLRKYNRYYIDKYFVIDYFKNIYQL